MLQLEETSKRYSRGGREVIALQPTNLSIAEGDYVALVGASGSGKTTLLSIIGGMLAPTTGSVLFDGKSIYELPIAERTRLRRDRIGFVFQSFNLIPYLTALENVQVPLLLAGVAAQEQKGRAEELLDRLGLGDRLEHKPGELSVGQQQRVALARTLANNPSMILADEPTGNLDPETREQVLGIFDQFHQDGRTILMVTHDPAAADRAARKLHLAEGHIVARRSAA